MRTVFIFLFSLSVLFLSVVYAEAFNGNRNGFVSGAGFGVGIMRCTQESADSNVSLENKGYLKALAVDLIIGYGISDKLLIYYNNKELWTETRRMSGKKEVFVNSMGPFGLSWYFKNNSPSLFLNAGAGFAHFYAPFENDQELDYGFGIYAGLGYEFIKHYSLNLTYMAGFTNREDDGIELGTDTQSLLFTLTALCY